MKAIFSILLPLFVGLLFNSSAIATPLTGTIRSDKGRPLAKVKVLTYAPIRKQAKFLGQAMTMQRYEVVSDDKGFFRLPDHGRVIYFTHPELRPVTKIIPLTTATIQVVMEDAAASLWTVPQCKAESAKQQAGIAFKVIVPEIVLVKKGVRFDLDVYYYGYKIADGSIEVMVNWQDSTSSHPSEETLIGSKRFTERMWRSGKRFGYDVRGERRDGKVWRFVSYRWGAISYQGNSPEAARVFDMMIDGICFDEEDAKKYPTENF